MLNKMRKWLYKATEDKVITAHFKELMQYSPIPIIQKLPFHYH